MIGDLMQGQGVIELPLLEESLFDGHGTSIPGMGDDSFPPNLIFSPTKGLCPQDLSSVPRYKDLAQPGHTTISSPVNNSPTFHNSASPDVFAPQNLRLEQFAVTKKPKPKKRGRKRRTRGNTSKTKRKKTGSVPPVTPTPRMCTAPLCGTMHASVDALRSHIKMCHPTMRMRCWFPSCNETFMVPEDLEAHAMDEHMPKRESSFFSRTKIRFKELTEVPADGEIRPTKERRQRAPRVPTSMKIYSGPEHLSPAEKVKPTSRIPQLLPPPTPSPAVLPPTIVTPVPSPSFHLKQTVPFKWMGEATVEAASPSKEKGVEEFYCLDPNPRMPMWNKRVTEMHRYWVNDRKRAGYTPEIEVTDSSVAKGDRVTIQTNITSFITEHLSNLSAVMHVDDQAYSGQHTLSFTMDTPISTVLARVTGMEYSMSEWDEKLAATVGRIEKGFYELNHGAAVSMGSPVGGTASAG